MNKRFRTNNPPMKWLTDVFEQQVNKMYDITDFEKKYDYTKQYPVSYVNQYVETLFKGFVAGNLATSQRMFGHFVIGRNGDDGGVHFSEKSKCHSKYFSAATEAKRLRTKYNASFTIYQSVITLVNKDKPQQPTIANEGEKENVD